MLMKTGFIRKVLVAVCSICAILAVIYAGGYFAFYYTRIPLPLHSADKASTFVKSDGKKLLILNNGTWTDFKVAGVNIKGSIPGGLTATYEMYMQWFDMIQDMNANTIQADDLLGNEFYKALHDYNVDRKEPLYLIQAITLEDEVYDNMLDAYTGNMGKLLRKKGYEIIDVVHGSSKNKDNPYIWDVSPWTLAYILGTDWDQDVVLYTNDAFTQKSGYSGKYISTWPTASAFETVLAEAGDNILSYETSKYGQQRLLGFRNWARTDALFHNSSWSVGLNENLASVNLETLKAGDTVKSGIFAAYHIEPNYPQFLSFDPEYTKFIDEDGKPNPYKGYLKALNEYHKLPIVISGFGIPSSRGISSIDEIRGFNQGGLDENQQGMALQTLYNDIMDAGLAGGSVISWCDDWGQTAWNTRGSVDTNRTQYWSDAQTSTQSYGLLAFEPGMVKNISYADGDVSEWSNLASAAEKDGYKLQIMYDERYMYFHVKLISDYFPGDKIYIPIDITPRSGARNDTTNSLLYDRDMDFVIEIDGKDNSKILVQEYYNNIYPLFGSEVGKPNIYINMQSKDTGQFSLIKQLARKSMADENGGRREALLKNAGALHYGNSNPDNEAYDSLSDFIISGSDVEIRIPWALLNFSDPSRMMIHDDYYKNYGVKFMNIKELYAGLIIKTVSETVQLQSGRVELKGWEDNSTWHARLKKSYYALQDTFKKYKSN